MTVQHTKYLNSYKHKCWMGCQRISFAP